MELSFRDSFVIFYRKTRLVAHSFCRVASMWSRLYAEQSSVPMFSLPYCVP